MFDDFLPITIGFYTDFWRYQDEVNRLYHLFFQAAADDLKF